MALFGCGSEIPEELVKVVNYEQLTNELDSILILDQKYRYEMEELTWNTSEWSQLSIKQAKIDSSNVIRIVEIINQIDGYPGKSLVGKSASESAFYVLQHAPDSIQELYYEMIIDAAMNSELDKRLAALYQDRYLMHKGEPQLFGTQIRMEFETDSLTGEQIEVTFVWPIADTANIDALRRSVGLGNLEDYLENHGLSRWN
jgi:hypothetical protein